MRETSCNPMKAMCSMSCFFCFFFVLFCFFFCIEALHLSQQFFSLVRMGLTSTVVSCSRTQHGEACGDQTQDLFI